MILQLDNTRPTLPTLGSFATPGRSMNLTRAATFLGVSPRMLRLAIDRAEIAASHPFAEDPWVLNQRDLQTSIAAEVVRRAHHSGRDPAIPTDQQATFGFSNT